MIGKKYRFILIILLFGYFSAHAQNFLDSLEKPKCEIGIEGGPTNADVRTFDISTSKLYHKVSGLNNICLGITGQYNVNNYLSIKSGIRIEGKGFEDDYGLPGTPNGSFKSMVNDTTNFTSINYIIVPVLAKVEFTHNHLYFLINCGFYISYLFNASATISDFDTSANIYNHFYNPIKEYHQLDFGLIGGMGLGIKLNKRLNFEIEGQVDYGLANISSASNIFPQLENESVIFLLGLRYNLNDMI